LLAISPAVAAPKEEAVPPGKKAGPAKTLVGTWKGVLKREGAPTEYLITVSADQTVSVVRVSAPPAGDLSVELNAETGMALPATLEADGLLSWQVRQAAPASGPSKTTDKLCFLQLDPDNRHALFSYKITVTTSEAASTSQETLSGAGRMTRGH
jgi:hypothetical protein